MIPFWAELRRRNVFKVGVAYAIVAWLLIQVVSTVFPALQLPSWTVTFVIILLIVGLPIALVMAWAFEIVPEGDGPSPQGSSKAGLSSGRGQKLNYLVTALLVLAVGVLAFDNYLPSGRDTSAAGEVPTVVAQRDRRSIAVLPFENRSALEADELFVGGIHDDLLTQLAKIGALKVISRTSVMEYRDRRQNLREIGQALGVATILEGAVQRAGDTVRINVQLIDAETDEHLWAESYDRELTAENIFAIQSEMATSIARALEATLSPQEIARLADVPTQNLRAYDFYLSGNDYLRRPDNLTAYSLAAQQYQRAVEEDPSFALAWAGLSRAHSGVYFFGVDRSEARRELARAAMDRAFELAPNLPEAHLARGFYHYHGFRDYASALQEFAIAEAGMPGDPLIYLSRAYVYRRTGEFQRSAASLERAIELDPRNLEQLQIQANNYALLRDYDAALRTYDRAIEIAPDNLAEYALSRALMALYRDGDAAPLEALVDGTPADLDHLRRFIGWTAAFFTRDFDAALRHLDGLDMAAVRQTIGAGAFNPTLAFGPLESYYAVTYWLAGRDAEAVEQFRAARAQIEANPESGAGQMSQMIAYAEALVALGEGDAALRVVRQVEENPFVAATLGGVNQLAIILRVLLPAGDVDGAMARLDAYLASPGVWSIEGLARHPRIIPVRDDPRFEALLEKYRRR